VNSHPHKRVRLSAIYFDSTHMTTQVSMTRGYAQNGYKDKARPGVEPRVSLIPEGRANRCTTGPLVGGITNSNTTP